MSERLLLGLLFLSVLLLTFAACEEADDAEVVAVDTGVEVDGVWGRATGEGMDEMAFFMTIVNHSAEEEFLFGVESSVCGETQLMEMVETSNGVVHAAPVENNRLEIPAESMVRLRPGGSHLNCLDLETDLAVGAQVPLQLLFADAGAVEVVAEIRGQ